MLYVIMFLVLIGVVWLLLAMHRRELVWRRLVSEAELEPDPASALAGQAEVSRGVLANWLFRAGYRRPIAPLLFVAATLIGILVAVGFVMAVRQRGLIDLAVNLLYGIPGGVGNVMVPFALALPWFLVVVIALLPTLVVRATRRQRVGAIQQDLPLMLDLLNTLAQAGIGFDAALERILAVQPPNRPLVQDFRLFQRDTMAGRPRVDALRRLMTRVSVPMFSAFISALIQAEQSGAGMAATLRIQAIEIRSRRRERATAAAMAVPTKLVAPMVIGFLPGIFIVLLGPMINEAFGMMGQMMRGVSGQ
ncbi:type II secretion system F family protein [Rhodopirellula sp. JC639]|uniref:type II secretion system F family protein n=1 Tax=Stieleria mannarensis TaxID=2755585 RepID=UPI001603AF8B|nr:type II secretion system F family protein [Rhodopirellula sp. JC639]